VTARASRAQIAFACPSCGEEAVADREGVGHCRSCHANHALAPSASIREGGAVDRCPACAGEQLYVQRDFNQKAGLAIVIVGAALAPFTPFYSSLIVATLLDAALYLVLPEITICYRCQAHFRGFARNPRHQPFDLHIAEQYGTKGR
jgi:ribosomal protein L37AE/L43A